MRINHFEKPIFSGRRAATNDPINVTIVKNPLTPNNMAMMLLPTPLITPKQHLSPSEELFPSEELVPA
jgi:hypothetical protein